jgi:outer membrane protein OmpA-like peptidoglycan-associated protein
VRQWLVANGVGAERLEAEGRGSSEPIADNATDAGRLLNRRVQAARVN